LNGVWGNIVVYSALSIHNSHPNRRRRLHHLTKSVANRWLIGGRCCGRGRVNGRQIGDGLANTSWWWWRWSALDGLRDVVVQLAQVVRALPGQTGARDFLTVVVASTANSGWRANGRTRKAIIVRLKVDRDRARVATNRRRTSQTARLGRQAVRDDRGHGR
jgi:hypothetical protein